MATNLLLLEMDQRIAGIGNPHFQHEWGDLYLDILSYRKHKIEENLPSTRLYVGVNQSLHTLGIPRKGVNLLGFEFNSGDYAYWREEENSRFVDDLRWVRDRKNVDLQSVSPLGYLGNIGKAYTLNQEPYGLILEKILEAQRR